MTARRPSKVLLILGVVLLIGAVVWRVAATPALVKLPTDTDVTTRYQGTLTLYVNPADASPLATPTQLPLTVERHVTALPDQSDGGTVVMQEHITERAGTLLDTTQTNQYVVDRRTALNEADGRSWAFEPANVVDRSGSYRLNLPFGVDDASTYPIYRNETGTRYDLRPDPAGAADEQGLTADRFLASLPETPLTDAYLAELDKAVPLPRTMTLDQLRPQLLAAGVDVNALLAALTPVITPADLATLTQIAGGPIPLRYVVSFDGRASIEPTTGAQVHVANTDTIGARPELTTLPQLQEVLGHYPQVPEAVAANQGLTRLAQAPATRLIELRYDQTPDSVAESAARIADSKRSVQAATWWIPGALAIAGLVLLVVGAVGRRRRPHEGDAGEQVIDLRSPPEAAPTTGVATNPAGPSTRAAATRGATRSR